MSVQFMNFMSMSLCAAKELQNPVLETLLSDYAKDKANNKLQYIMIKLLAKKHCEKINEDNRVYYNLIKRYISYNSANITRHLLYE